METKKEGPTKEQYEKLISLLEEENKYQEKTIDIQRQQIEVLSGIQ